MYSASEDKKRFAKENVRLSEKVSAAVEEMQQLMQEKATANEQLRQQTKKQEQIIKNYYANQVLEHWYQCQIASYAAVRDEASLDEKRRIKDQVWLNAAHFPPPRVTRVLLEAHLRESYQYDRPSSCAR